MKPSSNAAQTTVLNSTASPVFDFCYKKHISRAELIRRSIDFYLAAQVSRQQNAFGLLKGREIDGLEYQKKIRED